MAIYVEDRINEILPGHYCYTLMPDGDLESDINLFIEFKLGENRKRFKLGEIREYGDASYSNRENIVRAVLIRLIVEILRTYAIRSQKRENLEHQLPLKLGRIKSPRGLLLRFLVLARDGFRCRYCGRSAKETILHVDHIYPKSKGGKNNSSNLITSCRDCNLGKSDLIIHLDKTFAKMEKSH